MTESKSVRIATFNINGLPTFYHIKGAEEVLISHRVRHLAICEWFEKSDIDTICFQEVFTYRNLKLLKKHLPSYKYVAYKPFVYGPKGALVVFSKYPIRTDSYSSFLATSGEIKKAKLPKLNILRSALKGMLVVKLNDMPITVINTHLVYNGNGQLEEAQKFHDIHVAQLNLLSSIVKKQIHDTKPGEVIVTGDLNVEVGEMTSEFLKNSKLRDLFEGDNEPSFHNEFLANLKFKKRIDFILTSSSKHTSRTEAQRIFTGRFNLSENGQVYLSDHQGLVASIP